MQTPSFFTEPLLVDSHNEVQSDSGMIISGDEVLANFGMTNLLTDGSCILLYRYGTSSSDSKYY